jgi:hypothetical protein
MKTLRNGNVLQDTNKLHATTALLQNTYKNQKWEVEEKYNMKVTASCLCWPTAVSVTGATIYSALRLPPTGKLTQRHMSAPQTLAASSSMTGVVNGISWSPTTYATTWRHYHPHLRMAASQLQIGPQLMTATTNSKHSWGQLPLYGSRNYHSPVPRFLYTTVPLPGELCTLRGTLDI